MINSETFIVKRDGKKEAFSLDKIKNAISKAFLSVGSFATQDVITNILSRVNISDGTSVEDIQNQVEIALMAEHYYSVAKAFMLYRQKHLEDREVRDKLRFLMDYCDASNPATGSKYDANANVENKNIATLIGELPKSNFIRLNRRLLTDRLKDMYGKELSDRYIELLNQHFIYKNDETNLANYCASITMYPWLISGTASVGGNSTAPTNLKSFCGGFINMVFIVSSMLSGACATPEFLMYMNYFIEKEYGEDYYKHPEQLADLSSKQRTIDKIITDCFEQIVYSINQPTGARNFQAVFWNVAYYDQYYFNSLFEHFVFPDGNAPHWESLSWLQKRFMKWFNKERTKAVLTFPVETMALLTKDGDVLDKEYGDFTAEMYAEGHSFFTYISDSADSLASCCRLRNELAENTFSPTSGLTGVMTGSCNVITLNINRIVQDWALTHTLNGTPLIKGKKLIGNPLRVTVIENDLKNYVTRILERVYKYHIAFKTMLYDLEDKGMFAASNGGYIHISKLYSTIGINGLNEAARFLGMKVSNNPEYIEFLQLILGTIKEQNKLHSIHDRKRPFLFNSEVVPAEGLGGKNYKWDKEGGYVVPEDENLYNSYFYNAHDDTSILDKFILHGHQTYQYTDGGSAAHINLEDHLSKEQYLKLIDFAIANGTNYFTFNIPNSKCEDCGKIIKRPIDTCPCCGSHNITQYTRVIGYLRPTKAFGSDRQTEALNRKYSDGKSQI